MAAKFFSLLHYRLSRSAFPKRIEFEQAQNSIKLPSYEEPLVIFQGNQTNILKEQPIQEQPAHQEQVHIEPIAEAKGIRRSSRIWKPTIFSDYIVVKDRFFGPCGVTSLETNATSTYYSFFG